MKNKIQLIDFPIYSDARGNVIPFEFDELPFMPRRFFTTAASAPGIIRGNHGHFVCQQIIFSISGMILVNTKSKDSQDSYVLEPNGKAIYLPAGLWCSQTFATGQEILGCLASHPYDARDFFETM